MAARVRVFLKDPPKRLELIDIRRGIEAADWLTLAEAFDIEEEEARVFMRGLRWHRDPIAFDREGERPVRISQETDPEMVRFLIEELGQFSKPVDIPGRVGEHLRNVKGIVSIEMGGRQERTLYETIAFEIAYWLAETFGGLILSPDHQWYDHDKNRWRPIQGQ